MCGTSLQNAQLLKLAVNTLNDVKENNGGVINNIVKEIKQKLDGELQEENLIDLGQIKINITKQLEGHYDIEFLDSKDDTLQLLQKLKLIAYKRKEGYDFGIKLVDETQEFTIGLPNAKLPYKSQVSALEGIEKHLTLIATATGSGKTITKLMFSLAAKLSGMNVVSVDPRDDLVEQEYKDQKEAVSYGATNDISHNNRYNKNRTHNILSLNQFFTNSREIVNLEKLSRLIDENNAQDEGFKVDLKNKKIIIGENIEIYQGYYEVGGKKHTESIFDEQALLVIFDEIQDMINKGEAYYIQIQLLILLASWKKINLVVTTATPPIWMKDFIEIEGGHIEAQSLQEKIKSGVGGRIDVEVHNNIGNEKFVQDYVDYICNQVLIRSEGENYYYDPKKDGSTDTKQKIRKYIVWNLQSSRNRMILACIDFNKPKDLFKYKIESPEAQLKTLKDEKEIKKQVYDYQRFNKCDFYHQTNNYKSYDETREVLIEQFGCESDIDAVLNEFDYKSSVAESGVFTVEYGFINNVISCITEIPLDELDKKRFLNPQSFEDNFKKALTTVDIDAKISEYIKKLDIQNQDIVASIHNGMKIVRNLFIKYKDNDEKLNVLLNNHNLNKEIHSMMPPDFSKLSDNNIVEIFVQGKSYGIFQYLKNNYEKDCNLAGIGEDCEKLYEKLEEGIKAAKKYKHEKLDPALCQYKLVSGQLFNIKQLSLLEIEELREKKKKLHEEYRKCKDEHERLTEEPRKALIEKFGDIQIKFKDKEKYPLNELRAICNKFSIIDENSLDRCDGDDLSRAGLVGFYCNDNRKSGFNNTILNNVVMKETTKDSLEDKKQCVGRPGRKNGPTISLSYIDSSKIGNPKKTKEQLINGSPFESDKKATDKIDPKEAAAEMVAKIEEIIKSQCIDGKCVSEDSYDNITESIIQCVLDTRHKLYNRSGYSQDITHKVFIQTLKNAISNMERQLRDKGIVTGDSKIKFNMRGTGSKIDKILEELNDLQSKIQLPKEKRDKINEKLKIEGNLLKSLVIKLCMLVLRLLHWRLNPEEVQVQNILDRDSTPTIKERIILRKGKIKIEDEIKPLVKEEKKQKDEKTMLTEQKIDFQDQYNKIHAHVGVIKIKDNIIESKITESEKDQIIKKQRDGISAELNKVQSTLNRIAEKHTEDLDKFEELKNKLNNIELQIARLNDELGFEQQSHRFNQRQNMQELAKRSRQGIDKYKDQTQIERLYNIVSDTITELSDSSEDKKYQIAQELSSHISKFREEKARLEKIQEEQKELIKQEEELERDKQKLQDSDKHMDICRRLLIYKSINNNYELNRVIWSIPVFYYFSHKLSAEQKDITEYISSPVFLELFTNIIMPSVNDGTLKMKFDVFESNGDSSAKKVEEINQFYKNLIDMKFDNIKGNISNILQYMSCILVLVGYTKLHHHIDVFKKDSSLIKKITFGKFDPIDLINERLQGTNIFDVDASAIFNQLLQQDNLLTTGIYNNDLNSGTTIFSTANLLMKAGRVFADYDSADNKLSNVPAFFRDSSVRRAQKVIEKLGDDKDIDDIIKDSCDNLKIFKDELSGCDPKITFHEELTQEEKYASRLQGLAQKSRLVSKLPFSARLLIDPNAQCLDAHSQRMIRV